MEPIYPKTLNNLRRCIFLGVELRNIWLSNMEVNDLIYDNLYLSTELYMIEKSTLKINLVHIYIYISSFSIETGVKLEVSQVTLEVL